MGLTISSLFSRLFGKKQMRILMGERRELAVSRTRRYQPFLPGSLRRPHPGYLAGGPARRSGDRAASPPRSSPPT